MRPEHGNYDRIFLKTALGSSRILLNQERNGLKENAMIPNENNYHGCCISFIIDLAVR